MFDMTDNCPWDMADQMAAEAFESYQNGQIAEAIEQLTEAIEINPKSAWYFNLGLSLDALEKYEQAICAYKKALELEPDDPEILNSLAVDYTRTGLYDLSIETFEHIEKVAPDFEPCYCNRIITYAEMNLHDRAEQMFYLAQQLKQDCPICFYNIGNSLFSRGIFKKAIWCWQKTASLEPAHPQINYRIAQAYWADGQPDMAGTHFLSELRSNPGDSEVLLDFGIFLLKQNDTNGAGEKFRRMLELNPNCATAYFYLGEIALSQQNTEDAQKRFIQAADLDDKLPGPRFRLAQIAEKQQNLDRAGEYLRNESELDIQDVDVLMSMGSMFSMLGQEDCATDCFLKAIDQDSDSAEAFACLGSTLAKKNDHEGAIQFLEHAISLGADDAEVFAKTAYLYLKNNNLILAEQRAAAALKIDPDNKFIRSLAWKIRLAAWSRRIFCRFLPSQKQP